MVKFIKENQNTDNIFEIMPKILSDPDFKNIFTIFPKDSKSKDREIPMMTNEMRIL
jgi:hypothetical protein